jgi:glutathione S-transferase
MYFSPWTEKARWALDHHGVSYRYKEHLIIFGMPVLRWKMRRWRGDVTVPAYVDGRVVCGDSWDIARLAEKQGHGAPLFPPEELPRIETYNWLSERALESLRILASLRLLESPEAQAEVLPPFVPGPLRRWLVGVARFAVAYIQREFGFGPESRAQALEQARSVWAELLRELRAAGGQYLLGGRLTYADVAMAVAVQGLKPVSVGPMRLPPAYERCWTTPELQDEFAELIRWRDRIYERHRRGANA